MTISSAAVLEDGDTQIHFGRDAAGAIVLDVFDNLQGEMVGSLTVTRAEIERALAKAGR